MWDIDDVPLWSISGILVFERLDLHIGLEWVHGVTNSCLSYTHVFLISKKN